MGQEGTHICPGLRCVLGRPWEEVDGGLRAGSRGDDKPGARCEGRWRNGRCEGRTSGSRLALRGARSVLTASCRSGPGLGVGKRRDTDLSRPEHGFESQKARMPGAAHTESGWHRGRSVPIAEDPGAPTSAACYLNSRSSIQSPAMRALKTPCSQSRLSGLGDSGAAWHCVPPAHKPLFLADT